MILIDTTASAADDFEFVALPTRTANEMVRKAELVRAVPAPTLHRWSITFAELADFEGEAVAQARDAFRAALGPGKSTSIYVINLSLGTEIRALRNAVEQFRTATDRERAFARPNPDAGDSSCLYVGSSENTIPRLIQHLGAGHRQTYALHLSAWATDVPGGIELSVYSYASLERDTRFLLEDRLSCELKPLMGRRGNT